MAVSRPLLLVLLGVALVGAVFYVTRGSGDSAGAGGGPPAVTPPAKPHPKAPVEKSIAQGHRPRHAPSHRAKGSAKHGARPPAGGARTAPSGKQPARRPALPRALARALARHRKVLLFFFQPGASDDLATAGAVAALRRSRGLAVFRDRIQNIARYEQIVDPIGVSRAPSIVIVGRDGRARLIEGFVDRETLAQAVAETR